jgi:hypothetical protein
VASGSAPSAARATRCNNANRVSIEAAMLGTTLIPEAAIVPFAAPARIDA